MREKVFFFTPSLFFAVDRAGENFDGFSGSRVLFDPNSFRGRFRHTAVARFCANGQGFAMSADGNRNSQGNPFHAPHLLSRALTASDLSGVWNGSFPCFYYTC